MEQEQIDRYNKQKGKTRAKKLMPTSPVEAYINSRIQIKEQLEQQKQQETIEKKLKDIFK